MSDLLILKIGRHEYVITEKDVFMDNNHCVALLSQSKERVEWGWRPSPILSKRAIREISNFDRVQHPKNTFYFSLRAKNE